MSNKDLERGYTDAEAPGLREKGREEGATSWNKGEYDALHAPDSGESGGFLERNNYQDRS